MRTTREAGKAGWSIYSAGGSSAFSANVRPSGVLIGWRCGRNRCLHVDHYVNTPESKAKDSNNISKPILTVAYMTLVSVPMKLNLFSHVDKYRDDQSIKRSKKTADQNDFSLRLPELW